MESSNTVSKPFCKPKKKIISSNDIQTFHSSTAYKDFINFIAELNHSVIGKKTTEPVHESQTVLSILKIHQTLKDIVDEIKPDTRASSRFGSPAFKLWYNEAKQFIPGSLETLELPKDSIPEIATYLTESFGDSIRVDYGTGHEANYLCFLLCLKKLNLFMHEDFPAVVLRVFYDYIDLMRKIQLTYWLEPAGSHGVWGLDDYHFLPFLFGSAQLKGHEHFSPKCIHDSEVIEEFHKDYMYLSCIKFVNSVKPTSTLRWHSPMLDDISGVKTWAKVNEGMLKMYNVEVLGKLPVMQHFYFGSLISFDTWHNVPGDKCSGESGSKGSDEHSHLAFGQEAPACCGIRVPSAIGAAAFGKPELRDPGIPRPTRLPFD